MNITTLSKTLVIASALTLSGAAYAQTGATLVVDSEASMGVGVKGNATSSVKTEVRGNATSSAKTEVRGNATSSAAKADATARKTATSTKGELTSEAHRSAVAVFVQKLLSVADREGGIGTEVRAVAKLQNDSASTSAKAIANVENRGKLRAFLFGSDWKSIGELRSEMATTANSIARLKTILSGNISTEVKAEITAQIEALEDLQAKIEAFVTTHEKDFGLFGWFTKFFSR